MWGGQLWSFRYAILVWSGYIRDLLKIAVYADAAVLPLRYRRTHLCKFKCCSQIGTLPYATPHPQHGSIVDGGLDEIA